MSREKQKKLEMLQAKNNHVLPRTCECRERFLYHWHMKIVIHSFYTYFFGISYDNMNNRRMEKNSTDGD